MRFCLPLLIALLATSACSPTPNEQETSDADAPLQGQDAAQTPIPVEPDGGIGDGAGPPKDLPSDGDAQQEPSAFAQTFPTAIRGKWRQTDGAAVTKAQCDGYQQGNMGKVLTIREDGYSFFETGGKFISVSDRAPGHIRALFDTTYADEPTRDELEFRVDPVAKTLTVRNFDTGERSTTTYRRCPG
ncbi:hypothetical protein [Erythrobacter sp. YJ-T3-07]|uniref:hypothetical protein n=1 Tax=Erythrobacter sp. YJ-T3-07 TaxID=2793063 RepID=UPI001F2D3106|nr:hypothetical protein [Erythrobacter sp. YJ-T3-07]